MADLVLNTLLKPTPSEAQAWFRAAHKALGRAGMLGVGLSGKTYARLILGHPARGASIRLVWIAWSMSHCPSNLADLHTWATWGRFNPAMPQDYRSQAMRLLNRKSGPAKTGKVRKGKPWAENAKAKKLHHQYLATSCYAPTLYG